MIAVALLAVSAEAAGSALVLSGGVGMQMTDQRPYVGDTQELARALGSTTDQSSDALAVPILSQGCWQRRAPGEFAFGVELTERWWWVWAESRSLVASSASHRIDRSVVAFDAAVRVAFPAWNEQFRFLLGVGPAVHWIGTRQRGWLGDQDVTDLRVGIRGSGAARFAFSSAYAMTFDLSVESVRVPKRSVLLNDGGSAAAVTLGIHLEVWL